MSIDYWSVPVIQEKTEYLQGKNPTERTQRVTTTYDLSGRRFHKLEVAGASPAFLLRFVLFFLLFFVLIYAFTLFVPGVVLAVTKDAKLSWVFVVWAGIVLVIAALQARRSSLSSLMIRNAFKERGTPAGSKIVVVKDREWDRWVAGLQRPR
jgi:hypothetical protein